MFVMHLTFVLKIVIYLTRKAQIVLFIAKEMKIVTNYLDFLDVFSEKKTSVLPVITKLNQYAIKLQKSQQLLYRSIFSLSLVELKTLKTYIKTNLANSFIQSSKFLTGALILFIRKPNGSLCLYINYKGSNDLIIKNWYLLPLIDKSLD